MATRKTTKKASKKARPAKKAARQASKKGKRKRMSVAQTKPVSENVIANVADQLLTLSEAAERLNCSSGYLRWLCNYRAEDVPFARKIGRNWMMPARRLSEVPLAETQSGERRGRKPEPKRAARKPARKAAAKRKLTGRR